MAGGWLEKVKDFVKGNPQQAETAIDKVEEALDERTGSKYSEQVDQGADALRDELGLPPEEVAAPESSQEPASATVPAPAPGPAPAPEPVPAPAPEPVPAPAPEPVPAPEPEPVPAPEPEPVPAPEPEPVPAPAPEKQPPLAGAS
jgi:outer membrane biosynthesis protein TonB